MQGFLVLALDYIIYDCLYYLSLMNTENYLAYDIRTLLTPE